MTSPEEMNTRDSTGHTAQSRKPELVFGSKGGGPGQFNCPSYVTVSPVTGDIIVSDAGNNRVQIFTKTGQYKSEFGTLGSESGQLDLSIWHDTGGISVTPAGYIAVADTNNDRVQIFDESGRIVRVIGSTGWKPGEFRRPRGLATDRSGKIYVCDSGNRRIQVLEQDGSVVKVFGTTEEMQDWLASGIAVCLNGDVVVTDTNGKLEVFSARGRHKATLGTGQPRSVRLKGPRDIAANLNGELVVSDHDANEVHVIRQSGETVCSFGCHGNNPGEFCNPVGVACRLDDAIVVVDRENNRVQIF